MTDDEGVVISDRQTVIADRTSINASERVFRVRLNLKAGAYDKNKIYRLVIANDTDAMFELMNLVAPEHLEIAMDNAYDYLEKVENAGSVFLGHFTSEPIGD